MADNCPCQIQVKSEKWAKIAKQTKATSAAKAESVENSLVDPSSEKMSTQMSSSQLASPIASTTKSPGAVKNSKWSQMKVVK